MAGAPAPGTAPAGTIHTVLGEIPAAELGVTYAHEHLLCLPGAHLLEQGGPDLILDSFESSAGELELFKQAGGGAIVEVTCRDYGQDAEGLAALSLRSGVHVVAATGHIMEGYWQGVVDVAAMSDTEIVEEMLRDLTEGYPEAPGVRAGVIKVGTSRDTATRDEERMLRAAALVQRDLGCAITTHCTGGTGGAMQVRIFEEAGANLEKVVIGHQDQRLHWDDHLAIARSGCTLGYDCVSKEKYEPESRRIEFVKRLIDQGLGDRVLLSGDLARKSYLTAYGGGPGFTYILWRFIPWLWQEGVSRAATEQILRHTPARVFAWER